MNSDDGIIRGLYRAGKLNVQQEWAKDVHYECITGSVSYNANSEESSDIDVVSICIPPIDYVFPYSLGGHIYGFGRGPQSFDVFQQHHILDDKQGKEYDVAIYGIVKYFHLAAENNPNILDVLFTKDGLITHIDNIGKLIRQNRKLFLSKHAFHRFTGYAYAQYKKMKTRNPEGGRKEYIDEFGMDVKHASHLVRLALECEQILIEGDLTPERNGEILKSIKRGDWSLERVEDWFKTKERALNDLYHTSTIPYSPDWDQLKRILMSCLEEKFGSLSGYMNLDGDHRILRKFEQIRQIVNS